MITPAFSPTATERVLPRLALDFTTASLDPRVTVTRALNTATRINSSGYIEIVNANLPRFDYSPTSVGTCRGLLIEESRANLVLQSSDYTTASWTKTDTTPTAVSGTSPDGTNTATLLTQGTAGNAEVWQSFVVGAGNTVTYSKYVKPGNAQWYMIQIRNGGGTSFAYAFFDLTNGVVGTTSSSGGFATITGSSITNVGNGWFRATFTVMIGASFGTAVLSSASVTANGVATPINNGTRYEWGSQAEVGAFATSYIPTTTTSLTRNTDQVSVTGTNFSSWYNGNQGTFKVRGSRFAQGTFAPFMSVNGGSNTNEMYMTQVGNSAQAYSSLLGDLLPTGTWATNTTRNFTFAYKANTLSGSFNGGTVANTTPATIPTVDRMFIGRRGNGLNLLSGYVEQIFYWPQYLTNAETQAFAK